ncbi:MAG: hypothetical protein R6X06_09560 [Gammaproteobacteria bacterium]
MLTLYHTTHCPNCSAQEKILQKLQAELPELHIERVNLETAPDVAVVPPIRAVPTLFINAYRFDGLMKADEIRKWLGPDNHDREYIHELLKTGQLDAAQAWLQQHPEALTGVLSLFRDTALELGVRIGLDTLMEELIRTGDPAALTTALGNVLADAADSLCIDLLHYLAMIATPEAIAHIRTCATRAHPEVRRVATELLEELTAAG